ncbi:unnamed protein product [Thelazia callipaeda]|uniref:FBA domain-containing protein n=1 Tax=Thelazia callipaeda TaxID=103827 RepID=A0A0N5CL95_THECL|nr:unnamed protein product [Thelazia callipaeda]
MEVPAFVNGNNDIYIGDAPIPPEVLTEILIRSGSPRSILCVCSLVCHRWCKILSAPGFWIRYMEFQSLNLPPTFLRSEPLLNIKKVSIKQPFGRNLIRNPSGDNGSFDNWQVRENDGDGFIIEKPPVGCSNSSAYDISTAFATSFGWCSKVQVVDLWREGIEPVFLDEFCPPITVSEYYTCRFDCSSVYLLDVQLLGDGSLSLTNETETSSSPDFYFGLSRPFHVRFSVNNVVWRDVTTDTEVIRCRVMEDWTATTLLILTTFKVFDLDAEWQKIEHTFTNYPKGIRYVFFEHCGKDQQFWAGHYGSKMAKASVVIHYGNGQRRNIDS